jgi:hypothetical protein
MVRRDWTVAVLLALLLAGCGGGSPYKTAPVSGRVTLDNKPLAHATVMFVPDSGPGANKEPPPSSVATTEEDGHYSLVLSAGSKSNGAVVGKHKVVISMGSQVSSADTKRTFHKQLPEKYNRIDKTTLGCEVPAGGRDDANFDLKSKR